MIGADPKMAARLVHRHYRIAVPVQPEQIAAELEIPIYYEHLSEGLSGLLLPEIVGNDRHYIIVVNKRHRPARRKFSIAHELGHYFLHRGLQPVFTSHCKRRGTIEREADTFAVELLMPAKEVREQHASLDFQQLRDFFGVSIVAMRRRLKELGLTNN